MLDPPRARGQTRVFTGATRPRSRQPELSVLLMRLAVITDWKFFLDDEDALNRWARRYGESGAQALAERLRQLPWRTSHS
jgi:hypothetical protein